MKFLPQAEDVPAAREKAGTAPAGGRCNPSATFFRQNVQPADFFIYICLEDIFEEKHVQQPHGSELVVALIGFK
ncbi:hypothetical protein [Alistipes communis]|uniref:hypothetical protein n=1 Tax=Alistipes communis TaxID=2585118 RepID=UPI0032087B80